VPTEPEVLALSDEDRFMAGTTAMLLQSRRVVPTLREIDAFVWDVAPLPVGEGGRRHPPLRRLLRRGGVGEPGGRPLLRPVGGRTRGQPIAAQSGRTVPSLVSVAESPSFLGPRGGIATGTEFDRFNPPASARVFTDTVADIRRTPSIATWTEVEEAFDTTLGRAFYGEIPIDEAIALAKARSEDAFRRAAESGG
jgi:multiple sugar transport system substrate-binding protein